MEGQAYHKSCFKCSHGGCPITPSNYAALEGILYCKHHFSQLFKEKGSYNHLIKSASIKRAAASVPESWMLLMPSIPLPLFFLSNNNKKIFWFVKEVFLACFFLFIIVLSWLDPFLIFTCICVVCKSRVIHLPNAHSVMMTNMSTIWKMCRSNLMM